MSTIKKKTLNLILHFTPLVPPTLRSQISSPSPSPTPVINLQQQAITISSATPSPRRTSLRRSRLLSPPPSAITSTSTLAEQNTEYQWRTIGISTPCPKLLCLHRRARYPFHNKISRSVRVSLYAPTRSVPLIEENMEAKPETTSTHFFKVMMPCFRKNLNLPPAFCEKIKQETSKWAIIKSCRGTWKIKVHRNNEGLISFKDGWPNFVYSHCLSIGDFVLFEHTGNMNFNATVFEPSACEREFLVKVKTEHDDDDEDEPGEANANRQPKHTQSITYDSKNPHFIVTMSPFMAEKTTKVTIPVNVWRSNNISNNKSEVILRDPRGRAWPLKLGIYRIGQFQCRMTSGWHDFYVGNKLKAGDICVFDINRDSMQSKSTALVMDVQIFPAPRV